MAHGGVDTLGVRSMEVALHRSAWIKTTASSGLQARGDPHPFALPGLRELRSLPSGGPQFLSENVVPEAVAGTGVVDTFTINHQPGLEVRYVTAVAIDGASGVFLTTNMVGLPG
jgi:hypothetical protein